MHLVCAGLEQKYDFVLENVTRIQDEMEKFQEELKELEENKGWYIQGDPGERGKDPGSETDP